MPRFVVDVADRVFDLVADEAMVDRRTVRDQAAVLIEQALGLRAPRTPLPIVAGPESSTSPGLTPPGRSQ